MGLFFVSHDSTKGTDEVIHEFSLCKLLKIKNPNLKYCLWFQPQGAEGCGL